MEENKVEMTLREEIIEWWGANEGEAFDEYQRLMLWRAYQCEKVPGDVIDEVNDLLKEGEVGIFGGMSMVLPEILRQKYDDWLEREEQVGRTLEQLIEITCGYQQSLEEWKNDVIYWLGHGELELKPTLFIDVTRRGRQA